jgi:methylthioribose-1-phosphate isomerase
MLGAQRGTGRQKAETAAELRARAANLRWAVERMLNKDGAHELSAFADQLEERAAALERGEASGSEGEAADS